MTGEKLRSLRRDHKPSKEEGDLLGPGEEEEEEEEEEAEAGGGAFTGGKGKGGHRLFSNHHRLPLKAERGPLAATTAAATAAPAPATQFPVHECVFKGDVRRLSALIRTQGIGQKDSHGEGGGGREEGPLLPHLPLVLGPRHTLQQ
ncbi:ankyrin repeat domain-containing protein 13C-like [Sceloporus undulatus]|uniref:ankyrin repeat domain-containing protein 13C-like n=1 Tax=Sceloporus undulatus TaxID=8520 RepID=UPI001C4AD36B|nr:ankyrin repeat domain-containing protein 13C-like [Sceloporus undulatus]